MAMRVFAVNLIGLRTTHKDNSVMWFVRKQLCPTSVLHQEPIHLDRSARLWRVKPTLPLRLTPLQRIRKARPCVAALKPR
jgi:hypothetical protein